MKLDDYKELYPDKEKRLAKYEIDGSLAESMLELRNHEAIKRMEDELVETVNGINTKLLTKWNMSEIERRELMTDKDRCMWFIRHFGNAEIKLKIINDYLEKL